jgi:Icc-related predicted phosphoesterase
MLRIVCISDTHGGHDAFQIPTGDILLHAGDFSKRGKEHEIIAFNDWLGKLPHKHKVVIAGNHDFGMEKYPEKAHQWITHAHYLNDSEITIEGLRIWGSPITPWFFDWAFNRYRGADIRKHWDLIPHGIDILITHGPPKDILDKTARGEGVGCEDLAVAIARVRPRLHVFGHIHEAHGKEEKDGTTYLNASLMDLQYNPTQTAWVIEL